MIPAILLNNWKLVVGGILLALLSVQTARVSSLKSDVAACEQRNLAQVSDWRAKYAEAVTQATQVKAATEAAQAQISTEIGNDTQKRLDALRASLAGSLRASAANSGSGGKANLPSLPYDPDVLERSGESTVISFSDAGDCGVAVIRLRAARQWALEQSQIDRSE